MVYLTVGGEQYKHVLDNGTFKIFRKLTKEEEQLRLFCINCDCEEGCIETCPENGNCNCKK